MRTIAHSIISQGGYGYIFDISCLSYWWLNEGFVMFLETYILDKAFPDSRMMDLFVVQNQYESRYLTSKDTANCMEYTGDIFKINPVISFSPIKGAVIWRMLEYLAHDVFWKSLHTYVNQTSFNFKTPDDLWYTMEAAARRHKDTFKDLSNLWKVKKAIDIWTKEKCCPVLNVIRNYETREVEISKNLDDKSDKSPYFIPVTFTINTDFNFVANRPNISNYLSEIKPTMKIFLDEKVKWIIVNIQQTGYYRVNYDFKNWQNLASYLNSDEYTNIHVLNRAQIIDDAFYMAINNKLNFCLFWKLVKYLWREKDYIAWYPMFKIFEYISNIYALQYNPVQFSTVIKFQEIVLNISSIFDPLGEHMYGPTVPTNNDFDKCLVQERSKWACFFDHPLCIKAAENQLKLYLNNSEKNTFLPDWRKWILCNGLKTANNSLWDHVSKVLKKAVSMKRENAAVFELLSCFKDHLIIQNYLSVTQTLLYENIIMKDIPIDEKMIKENNKMYALITNMYLSALSRHAKTTKGLEELLKNFEKMRPIHISTNAAMTVIINSALSSRQISTIHKFATRILSPNLIYQISPTFIIRNQKISHHMEFIRNLYEKLSIN
ncbi:aminopeptidase N-like isoform X2 [Nylanderia fulva]|nr:aminopeptidase N-like isoform X2 [Nylanderia fulva]